MKPYYQDDSCTIFHGDCQDFLPLLELESVGAIITDPPFNVGKDYGSTQDDLSPENYRALLTFIAEWFTGNQAWVTPTNRLALFSALLHEAYPVVIRRGAHGPKRWGWFDQFDMVMVRGRPSRFVSNLWDGIRLKGEGYFFRECSYEHPGYTPYLILARLVDLLCGTDRTVIDPFCGTGTTLLAAKNLNRHTIGIEIEERYCDIAARRLQQEVLPLETA